MRQGWDDALELQNELHHAMKTEEFARFLRWFSSGQSKGVSYLEYQVAPIEREMSESDMRYIVGAAAAMAVTEMYVPMWVSSDVLDIVDYASETFKPEAVYPQDLIVPSAFCVFERPMYAKDIAGRTISFRAVSWGEFTDPSYSPGLRSGPMLALWHHYKDTNDDYSQAMGPWTERLAGSSLLLMQTSWGPWGDEQAMTDPAQFELFRQIQVLWRLAKQQVAIMGPQRVSRPTWRSKYNWREIKTVQVFTLRRSKTPRYEGEESGRGYSHRFPVRGHWRDQWYPSLKTHRQIWVNGYVKGPEDKPFVAKRQAVEFIR